MQTIIVDMTPGFRMPTIYYSQGDVGTQFAIDLRSRFGDSFPTGTTVTIQATKPSGFGFSVSADSTTGGLCVFTTTAEMTDEFGRFPAELKVTKTGLTLFSANFYMDGEENTHPDGTIDGQQETVIPELAQLVERVEDAASSVLDMTVVANTLPAGSDATYSYDEETNTATFGIPKGADGSLASGVLAPTYSSSSTYAVGDYVYYSGSLYRCTTAITTAEAWTSGHWTQVALAPEVSDLKSALSNVEEKTFNELFVEGNSLTIIQTIDDYGLTANGRRSANALYAIDIYSLSGNNISDGDVLYLKIADDTAGVYQFQNDSAIPVNYDNTYVVGGVVTTAVDGLVTVPSGATYLMVSRNASRTDDVVANTKSRIDGINANIADLESIKSDFETHLIGENLVDSTKLETGYYYLRGVKSESAAMTSAWLNVNGISVINASGKKIANSEWSGVEMYYICSYDADKNYIADSMDNTGVRQYTIPDSAKYLTVSYVNTVYDEFTVVAGTKRPVRYVNSVEKTILMPSHNAVWYGKKWAAMGDSLTEYNDRNTKNYVEFISEATGISPTNLGVGGTGYMRGIESSPANSFYNRINTIPSDTDVLTIFGSFNDIGGGRTLGTIDDDISDSTVFGYVNATLDGIYTAIPTINIGIIAPTPWKDNRPWDDTETGSKYVEGLKQICYNRGIPFLDLYHCSNLRPWDATARDEFYSNDVVGGVNAGCHPDTKGHKMIAPKIKAFLESLLI